MKKMLTAVGCAVVVAGAAYALIEGDGATAEAQGVKIGEAAPAFTLKDPAGQDHSLADYKGKYVVLEWTNYGCPFVKKFYSNGDMQALQAKYTGKEVVWLSICSSAPGKQGHHTPEDAAKATADHKAAGTAYLLDEDGAVGRLYGAKTTPHIFIVDPDQNLIYQGAIDSIRSVSPDDVAKAENYVSKTLEAAMAGEAVDPASTQSYGCSVKY